MTQIRISTLAQEGLFQAAKWLKVQALLSEEELKQLLQELAPIHLFPLTGSFLLDELPLPIETFLRAYGSWIEQLKQGIAPTDDALKPYKAMLFTQDLQAVWLQPVAEQKYLVKPSAPFILVQVHQMTYSPVDQSFRPMTFGQESIFWGLQFAFPQVYQDPKTEQFIEEDLGPTELAFRNLRRWIREFTTATPMWVEGQKMNLPIRIGKQCRSWINQHPQLLAKHLKVEEAHAK
jgi:hypothetical protein